MPPACPPFGFTVRGCYALSKNCFTERAFKRRNEKWRNVETQRSNDSWQHLQYGKEFVAVRMYLVEVIYN